MNKTITEQRADALASLESLVGKAKAEDRDLTPSETIRAEELVAEIDRHDSKLEKAAEQAAKVDRLAGAQSGPGTPPGASWGKSVADRFEKATGAAGLKTLLQGEISTPPAVDVVELPATPTRLLDLINREALEANTFEFLRQTVATNAADVVADGDPKPTSTYTFVPVEERARVIAHLSEPFPLRFLDDHSSVTQVLEQQMRRGVLQAVEHQVVHGDGTGEQFTGLLHTSGVTDVAYAGDPLTTLRRAVTVLQGKDEAPTAWVLNPADAEELSLTREDGETGGFLFAEDFAGATVFGGVRRLVLSPAVASGTALLADWTQVRLGVRQDAHVLAATQAGDLFRTNRVMLRAEGRYGLKFLRPQALAVVHLESD